MEYVISLLSYRPNTDFVGKVMMIIAGVLLETASRISWQMEEQRLPTVFLVISHSLG